MPRSEPDQPVARVLVDVGLTHLDRAFDYRVRPDQDQVAVPGARVRVRFAGRLTSGYVIQRVAHSDHEGPLSELERAVSAEAVLTPEVAELARRVAEHYAGTRSDVLRLAIPPRHARTEAATPRERPVPEHLEPDVGEWQAYTGGSSLLGSLEGGHRPRAVVSVLPGHDRARMLARAAAATLAGGRGSIIVHGDTGEVAETDAALTALLGPDQHVALHADHGPSARYRRFLAVLRGHVRIVVGTRSAVFAPVHDLGMLAVWDDGDDLLAEPRAPYPHARDVALIRAHQNDCALLIVGYARTAEAARLLGTGWAQEVRADRTTVRAHVPRVEVAGPDTAGRRADDPARTSRMPDEVFRAVRRGLAHGPVLVQVPRRGYRPALSCQRCRTQARCPRCAGPLAQPHAERPAECRWCRLQVETWHCPECGGQQLRSLVVGDERTAEELGRAFPGVPVRQSGLGHVLREVPAAPALVIATPGAEPAVDGGYCAGVLLDAHLALARPDLRAAEESLRRWMGAAALVRPAPAGGIVVVVADPAHRAVQALVRWDPARFAERELADRAAVHLPPSWRVAEISGPEHAVDDLLSLSSLPGSADLLGPVPTDEARHVRTLVRVPLPDATALTSALRAAAGVRSAHRALGAVRVRVDPVDLG